MCEWGWLYNPIKPFQAMAAGSVTPGKKKEQEKMKVENAIEIGKGLGNKEVKPPTQADHAVNKAAEKQRQKAAAQAYQNIKTTPRGLGSSADIRKKVLLGE